jgi:type IV pilus assembly protein PilP
VKLQIALTLVLTTALAGCEDELPPPPPAAPAAGDPATPAPAGAPGRDAKGATSGEPEGLPPLPVADFPERAFQESVTNRDPFRNFAEPSEVTTPDDQPKDKSDVLVANYALEELKIVGIVTGSVGRVLVQDPTGLGWVLRVGDFVGREEGGRSTGASSATHWRLDRIRENDVVFIRESPDPSTPATTRVLSMRAPDELKREIRTGIRGTRPDEAPPSEESPAKTKG